MVFERLIAAWNNAIPIASLALIANHGAPSADVSTSVGVGAETEPRLAHQARYFKFVVNHALSYVFPRRNETPDEL